MKPRTEPTAAQLAPALAQRGQVPEAFALLRQAVQRGDAAAAATLAEWRLTGEYIRRDLGEARTLFGRAADLGLADAVPIYIALLANGAGGTGRAWPEALELLRERSDRDPVARRQLSLLRQMQLDGAGEPSSAARPAMLSASPRVEAIPSFLTEPECSYLVDRAAPLLEPSVVVHPTAGTLMRDPIRSSTAAMFPFVSEDPVIHAINRRIAAATGTTYEQGEPLQVLSYTVGQEYKLHSDALPSGPAQRILTLLVYLNDNFQGGATHFPDLAISHRGGRGDALLFANVDHGGQPDPRSRHAGLPIKGGRKWLLSKWIRGQPLDLTGPPGRPF